MEMALQLQTEELNRSRADYTALFQNFKQSRITFEEREHAGKANLQKIISENKVLDGFLKQVTAELKLCRSEFIDLQKNFEHSSTAAEEQNQTNKAQIQRLTDQYEIAKYKIRGQKAVIKEQRATQRDFEADLQKIEQSTNLFKIRDGAITDQYDTIAVINLDLREELKAKSGIVMRQAADVVRLNSLIADEMISKYDYYHILSENEELKRRISEETVSLQTYLTTKEKYASLLSYIEQRMVSTEARGVVLSDSQQSDSEQNKDYTTLTIEAELQENLQKSIDERCGVINTVQALQDAKCCILRELSESEERYTSVHFLLEEARAEIAAYKVKGELRIQLNSCRDDALDKNLISLSTILSVNDVRKEKKIVDDLEKLSKSLKKELQDERNFRSSQLEQLAVEHSSEIIELRKIMRIEMEEEKNSIRKDLLMIHGIEVQGLHDSYNLQLSFLSKKVEELRNANEVYTAHDKSLVGNIPDKDLASPRVQDPSNLTVGNRIEVEDIYDNDIIRLMTEKYKNNINILEGKNTVLKNEITALKDTLQESLRGLKFEKNRADVISSDLIRIELKYKNAILCVEDAHNKEILLNEKLNINDMKYEQCVDEMESKIKRHEELYKSIEVENEQAYCDNEILKEIAANLEMECRNLKGQLEDVKNAVLESMTITLPRNQQVHSSSLSSLDFLNHRNPSNAPTATTRTAAVIATTTRASTTAFQLNINGNNGKKLMKSATRIPRPKIPTDKALKTQDHFITPIQAALNRKQAFATAAATAAAAIGNALAMQPLHQHVKQKQRDSLKVPIPKQQQQKTIRTKKKPLSQNKGPVDTVNDGIDEHTDLTPTISLSMDFININTNTSCMPGQPVVGSDTPALSESEPLWSPFGDLEEAGHRVRACSTNPLEESVGAAGAAAAALPSPVIVTVDDSGTGAGWMDRISHLLSFQSDSYQHESDLLPYTLPLPVPVLIAATGTGGGGDAEVRVEAAANGGCNTVYHPVGPVNSDNGLSRHARTLETVHPMLSTSLSQPSLPCNTDKVSVLQPLTVSPSSLELMDRLIQSSRVLGPILSREIPSE